MISPIIFWQHGRGEDGVVGELPVGGSRSSSSSGFQTPWNEAELLAVEAVVVVASTPLWSNAWKDLKNIIQPNGI